MRIFFMTEKQYQYPRPYSLCVKASAFNRDNLIGNVLCSERMHRAGRRSELIWHRSMSKKSVTYTDLTFKSGIVCYYTAFTFFNSLKLYRKYIMRKLTLLRRC